MRTSSTIILLILLFSKVSFTQIVIDGDMFDWIGIDPITQNNGAEPVGDVIDPQYADFDLKDLYITHDTANVYMRIDLAETSKFSDFFNFDNEPVFEVYLDTEIGDTTGFDWGWWNIAMKYVIALSPDLHPDSTEKFADLSIYHGTRNPTYTEGEFEVLTAIPFAVSADDNALELSIPREYVNFGSEFRPWIYSVGNFDWSNGMDMLPEVGGGQYGLKYDFWYGPSVYEHNGPEIVSAITIDGDMFDWVGIPQSDIDEISEELGDALSPEFDVQDFYITSDSNYIYMKIDIDPSASFSSMYNYDEYPAFQIFIESNWGDTTGIGYGGFWRLAVDYLLDLGEILDPASTTNETFIYEYIADYNGAFEDWAPYQNSNGDTAVVMAAKNVDDNSVEIAIPRADVNVDTDVRFFVYVVGNGMWDDAEYFPNSVYEGWGGTGDDYYALNYNFITGPTVHRLGDKASGSTGVDDENSDILTVKGFGIVSNYPNPFNPVTNIVFTLTKSENISVKIYDVLGKEVAVLADNQEMTAGKKNLRWDGRDKNGQSLASGVYLYKISSSDFSVSNKMMLLK